MKNKTLLLTRILLKNSGGLGIRDSNMFTKVSVALVFLIMIPAMMIGIGIFSAGLVTAFRTIGQEGLVLSLAIAINSAIVFVFGIFYIMSTFYFSSDVEYLLPLPLRPKQIIGAKFLVVTIYEYFTTAVIFLPMLIAYGVVMKSGPVFYLFGIVVYLLMPIAPLAAASFLIMLIMRFTNLSRHKDTFKIIGGVLAVFLGMGVNLLVQNIAGRMSMEEIAQLLEQGNNSLVRVSSSIFPTTRWGAEALAGSASLTGLWSLLIYVAFSLVVYLILLWLGELIYLRGVVGLSESSSKRNKISKEEFEKTTVKNSIIKSYTMVELKILFRTPIYFVNCVMINFLWPVFILFPMLLQSGEVNVMHEISKVLNKPGVEGMVLAGAFAFALFMGGTNAVAPTAISREGQELFIKKYIPVNYKQQLTAKVLSGFLLGLISVFIMSAFAVILFKISFWLGLLILATAWLPILFTSYTGLLIDLYNPSLNWDNEQKAVKQNVNVLYNMIVGIVPGILTIGGTIALQLSLLQAVIILVVVYGGLCYLTGKLLYTQGVKRFCQLEG